MTLANEVKKQLARYVSKELSLGDFQEWLDWQNPAGDFAASGLSFAIEWAFCDFDRGVLSSDALQQTLKQLAAHVETSTTPSVSWVRLDSNQPGPDAQRYFGTATGTMFHNSISSFESSGGCVHLAHR